MSGVANHFSIWVVQYIINTIFYLSLAAVGRLCILSRRLSYRFDVLNRSLDSSLAGWHRTEGYYVKSVDALHHASWL